MQYMSTQLIARAKEIRDDKSIVEIVIWQLDEPLKPCKHGYKYRLFYGTFSECRVRYDNERGKGDHVHIRPNEQAYDFDNLETLLADFERDVTHWIAI